MDLSGQRFGRLVVLQMVDPYVSPSGKKAARCLCQCDCGNQKIVHAKALRDGRTKSCGCYNAEVVHKRCFMDLTGQTFGDLTVLYRAPDKIRGGKKRVTWHCKCKCGNEIDAVAIDLRKGKYVSCGCQRLKNAGSNFIDLTGQRFSKLTVVKRVEDHVKPSGRRLVQWLCKCDCGSEKLVVSENLLNGHTKSCGCVLSFGEETIAKLLSMFHIKFMKQYSFEDCLSSIGNRLYFDFALLDDENNLMGLLEYQGAQHYLTDEEIGKFGKIQREETDLIKKEYCEKNNYKLFEIRYNENINNKLKNILKAIYDNTVPNASKDAEV